MVGKREWIYIGFSLRLGGIVFYVKTDGFCVPRIWDSGPPKSKETIPSSSQTSISTIGLAMGFSDIIMVSVKVFTSVPEVISAVTV